MALRSKASLAAAAPRGLLRLFSTSSFSPLTPPQTNDKPSNREQAPPCTQLFVSGLNKRTTSEKLMEAFSQFGEVVYAKVVTDRLSGYSKGFGFVKYATMEEAAKGIEGMDGKFLEGWVIFAEYSRPKQPPSLPGSNTAPGYGMSAGPVFRSNMTYGSGGGYGNTTVPGNGNANASPGYGRPQHDSNTGPANWNTDNSRAYGGGASPTYGNTNGNPAYPSNTSSPQSSYGGPSYGNSSGGGDGSSMNGNAGTYGYENSPFYGSSNGPAYGNTSDQASYGNDVAHHGNGDDRSVSYGRR